MNKSIARVIALGVLAAVPAGLFGPAAQTKTESKSSTNPVTGTQTTTEKTYSNMNGTKTTTKKKHTRKHHHRKSTDRADPETFLGPSCVLVCHLGRCWP